MSQIMLHPCQLQHYFCTRFHFSLLIFLCLPYVHGSQHKRVEGDGVGAWENRGREGYRPFRSCVGNLGELQILTNRQTDTTTWKIAQGLVIWPTWSVMLSSWTETKLWTLKPGSKCIQTSLILSSIPKPYIKLLIFFSVLWQL